MMLGSEIVVQEVLKGGSVGGWVRGREERKVDRLDGWID